MSRFFIERPIFAIVIAVLIMLGGGLAIGTLPIEQLPPIAPPTIQVSASYPGASATTAQDTVVQVIEQQLSGIDHLLYMSSNSDDTGPWTQHSMLPRRNKSQTAATEPSRSEAGALNS